VRKRHTGLTDWDKRLREAGLYCASLRELRPASYRIRRPADDPVFRITTALIIAAAMVVSAPGHSRGPQTSSSFAVRIAAHSEPGGYFDTDNLISNERSYPQVFPELERRGVRGGAYIGVGPDQNFSYIAGVRPTVAFIVDIRRDNLLLHLLFKALFAQAQTRIQYLAMLFGRPAPADLAAWRNVPIERLVDYIRRPAQAPPALNAGHARLVRAIRGFGVPLSADDIETIARFHRRFIEGGLELQFETSGRAPQSYYPTYRDLLLGTDGGGRQRNYLASEESFQFIKTMQGRDRIVPVVGNLSGVKALASIARDLGAQGESLSVFYTSNVEFYLERDGTYPKFVANLSRLPRDSRTVVIRSIFNRGMGGSTSIVQPVEELLSQAAAAR
jgi:hypothetical protein